MKKRPLIFIILGVLHLIEPLIKIIYFKATTPFNWGTIFSNISNIESTRAFLEFWFLFPIAGIALLGVKKWSYPIFVGVQFYNIWSHLTYESYTWPYVSKVPFFSSLALLFFNVLIIIYFALPDVRRPFFDRRLRWWETSTRYNLRIPIQFEHLGEIYNGEIVNISRTGIFLVPSTEIEIPQHSGLKLYLEFQSHKIDLQAQCMTQHTLNDELGYGVQFQFENLWQNIEVRKMVGDIRKSIKSLKTNLA